jgi:serine protease Do
MKKLVLLFACFVAYQAAQAQDKKTQKSETIILEDHNGSKSGNTTIEIRDGEVFIDGKKVADDIQDKDRSVKIIKKKYLNGKEVPFDDNTELDIFSNPFGDISQEGKKAMLGVTFKPNENNDGAVVESVVPKSPADKMGIQPGDVITKVDDKNILSPKDLVETIGAHKPGDVVDITFERSNKMMTKQATLDKQSESMSFSRSFPFGEDMNMDNLFKQFQFNDRNFSMGPNSAPSPKIGVSVEDRADGEGVLVQDITANSAAEKAGMEKGDVITEYAGKPINSVDELMMVIQENQSKSKVDATVKRKGATKKLELTVPKNLKKKDL